jgi:hypothetical protein
MSHAIERARERYGVELKQYDLASMRRAIRSGDITALKLVDVPSGQSLGQHEPLVHYAIWYSGRIFAVTCNREGIIKTFLPPAALDNYGWPVLIRKRAWEIKQAARGVIAPY